MDTTLPLEAAPVSERPRTLSLLERSLAVFVRPAQAWTGLAERAQWWFPLLVMVAIVTLSSLALFQRALVPMMMEQMEQQAQNGQMSQDQLDRMERTMSGPVGMAISIGPQAVFFPVLTLVMALLIWFGVGFVLGTNMKYRLALEVACWSWFIKIPEYFLATALGWIKETMRGVHVGFGILLPDMDPPSKLHVALGVLLDGLGPFAIWYVVVGILGAAALSGAPRKSVAWVLSALYLVVLALVAAFAALLTPSA